MIAYLDEILTQHHFELVDIGRCDSSTIDNSTPVDAGNTVPVDASSTVASDIDSELCWRRVLLGGKLSGNPRTSLVFKI